jgi:bacillithiol system protein YtxJ
MTWKELDKIEQLDEISKLSFEKPQIIFKHSTRCSISVASKSKLDSGDIEEADVYYLDLLNHRDISNTIAEKYAVHHESPQIILIKNGQAVYDESHMAINLSDIKAEI